MWYAFSTLITFSDLPFDGVPNDPLSLPVGQWNRQAFAFSRLYSSHEGTRAHV